MSIFGLVKGRFNKEKETLKRDSKNVNITLTSIKEKSKWLLLGGFQLMTKRKQKTDETFAESVQENGLTKEDLRLTHRNFKIKVLISSLCSLACLGSLSFHLTKGSSVFAIASTFVFFVYFSVETISQIHKTYQIKNERFCSFKEFYKSGDIFNLEKWI